MKLFGEEVPWNALPELLEERAEQHGDAIALEAGGQSLTYADWQTGSDRLAANLARLGVRRGDRVACLLHNGPEQLLTWFGAGKLGAIWAPLNVGLTGEDLLRTLAAADPSVLIVDDDLWPIIEALGVVGRPGLTLITARGSQPGVRAFETLLASGAPRPKVELQPSDPAVLMFSGGTTGLPKAALLPHFSHIAGCVRYRQFWRPTQNDVHFTTLQLFHTGAQHGAAIAPLAAGVKGVLEPRFSASSYWRRVCETGATLIDPLGTMLPFLSNQPVSEYDRAHKVRACWFATAHLPLEQRRTFEERFGVRLYPGSYGSTECGGNYVVSGRFGDDQQPTGAIGKPWDWIEILIADDADRPVATGEIGNVLLRPLVANTFMVGYFRDPDRTAQATRNMWLHTGDLGRVDDKGYFYFEGRQLHWLRRRGENISALEIEGVLARHPAVAECAVVGVPAELGGEEEIKAFLIAHEGKSIEPAQIHQWCREHLAAFKAPRFIETVSDLPRSSAKREIERAKLKLWPHDKAWDAEAPGALETR